MRKVNYVGSKIRAAYQFNCFVLYRFIAGFIFGIMLIVYSSQGLFNMQFTFVAFIIYPVKIINAVGNIRCLLYFGN